MLRLHPLLKTFQMYLSVIDCRSANFLKTPSLPSQSYLEIDADFGTRTARDFAIAVVDLRYGRFLLRKPLDKLSHETPCGSQLHPHISSAADYLCNGLISSGTPSDEQARVASGVIEENILARAYGQYVDVLVFWYPLRYTFPEYRSSIANIRAALRYAVRYCVETILEDDFTIGYVAYCAQTHVAHRPAAALIAADYYLGVYCESGGIVEEIVDAHDQEWRIVALPRL